MQVRILQVPNMTCEACEETIREALETLKGVEKVQVNLRSQKISIRFNESKVDEGTILSTLTRIGYPARQ